MGTNFYLRKNRDNELQDALTVKDYGRMQDILNNMDIHIAKTSCGWLPLFQTHDEPKITSIRDVKVCYDEGYEIYDEYNTKYTWGEFTERVLNFNGGTREKRVIERCPEDPSSPFYDKNMPDWVPVSHLEYGNGKYAHHYFVDDEGYEFTYAEFS